nr:ribosomal protein L20 [Klebsormidium sp. TAA2-JRJ3pt]
MTRIKRGYVAIRRRKKTLALTKSFRGSQATLFRTANQRATKALEYSHRDQGRRKRDLRRLWITRLNAAMVQKGYRYSLAIHKLRKMRNALDRRSLAQMAACDPEAFSTILYSTGQATSIFIQN